MLKSGNASVCSFQITCGIFTIEIESIPIIQAVPIHLERTQVWSSSSAPTPPPLRYGLHIDSSNQRPLFRMCHGRSHLHQLPTRTVSFLTPQGATAPSSPQLLLLSRDPQHLLMAELADHLQDLRIQRDPAPALFCYTCQHRSTRCHTLLLGPHHHPQCSPADS